jgi:hypothetical protein
MYIGRAVLGTASASYTAGSPEIPHEGLMLVKEAVFETIGTAFPEVVTARHHGVALEETGIPAAFPLTRLPVKAHLIDDVETETGRAYHGADTTAKTAVSHLLPNLAFVLHVEDGGKVGLVYLRLKKGGEFIYTALVFVYV